MSELVVTEKLETAKITKTFVLNGQRLTDVPDAVLEDEWCQQYLQSLYLKNNLMCRIVSNICTEHLYYVYTRLYTDINGY